MALRQSVNSLQIQGYLNSKNLNLKTDKKGREFIAGTLEIRVDETNIIPVEVFSYKLKNDGTENKVFNGLITVLDEYIPATEVDHYTKADKVKVTSGQIKTNEFLGKDKEVHSAIKYTTNFLNRVLDDTFNPQAKFRIEMIVKKVRAEKDKEGEETGRGFVDGYHVDYSGNLQPIYITAEKKTFAKMEGEIEQGQTITFWGDIKNTVLIDKVIVEADFGEDEERIVEKKFKERIIIGAKVNEDTPFANKDIKNGLAEKTKYYQQLKDTTKFNEERKQEDEKEDEEFNWNDEE